MCVVTTSEPATEVPKPPPPWGHIVSHCGVSHSPLTPTSRPLLAATPNMVLGTATHHLVATSYPPPRMEKNKEEDAVVRRTPSTHIHIGTYIYCPHISAHGASCSQSYRLILQPYPYHTPIRSRTYTSNLLIITAFTHILPICIDYVFIPPFSPLFSAVFALSSWEEKGKGRAKGTGGTAENKNTERYRTEKSRRTSSPTSRKGRHEHMKPKNASTDTLINPRLRKSIKNRIIFFR